MPTLAQLPLVLIMDQPLSSDEKRELAHHILRLVRGLEPAPSQVRPPIRLNRV
ncbi:MAG: hypothetical protein V4813_13165 [Gemmatimonadota bacterium]